MRFAHPDRVPCGYVRHRLPMNDLVFSASPRLLRLRQAAIPVLFLLLGMVYATWASRIPALRDALNLNAAQLGLALLSGGAGAVGSFPLAAWLVGHGGARRAA